MLAVDIPTGIDGLTGEARPGAVRATATVTFAALKTGLLLGAGFEHAGRVTVADHGPGIDAAMVAEGATIITHSGVVSTTLLKRSSASRTLAIRSRTSYNGRVGDVTARLITGVSAGFTLL